MKIGLLAVDGVNNFPNFALMKLSAWHKENGDSVDWFNPLFSKVDRVYASKVFTFSPDYDYFPDGCEVAKGGTGYDVKSRLPDDVDAMLPDYSIYPQVDYAIGFLSRGCIRHCPWCVVPEKEGALRRYDDIIRVAQGRKKAVLMDNNFLANDSEFVREQLEKARKAGIRLDFNQALDCRLVTPEIARLLAKTKWIQYARFACDCDAEKEPLRDAVRLLDESGYHGDIVVYVLAKDVENALERVRFVESLRKRITPFVMPFRDITGGAFGPSAGEDVSRLARWCNRAWVRKSCRWEDYK